MKNQNGITLIALVITIIVLLILAGVSIAMLTGDNGLLTKSQVATMDSAIGAAKDEISTEAQAAMATYLQNKYASSDNSYAKSGANAVYTELTKEDAILSGGSATVRECNVAIELTGSADDGNEKVTITVEKGTRKVIGTIANNGTLSWNDIIDM